MTKKPRAIMISMEGLEEKEQLDLLWTLFDFANNKLPDDKMLPIYILPNKNND